MRRTFFIAFLVSACALFVAPDRAWSQDEGSETEDDAGVWGSGDDDDDDDGGVWGSGDDEDDEEQEDDASPEDDEGEQDEGDEEKADEDDVPPEDDEGEQDPASDETMPSDEDDDEPGDSDDEGEETDPSGMIPKPDKLKREGKEAQEARKKAMQALSKKHPAKKDGGGLTPVTPSPPPVVREAPETLPRLEHHGYLRTRGSLYYNFDLDTRGTSPVPPPLDSDQRGDNVQPNVEPTDSETLAGADMRFRYAPSLLITEDLRIKATFDILDNYVLGSSPEGLRGGTVDPSIVGLSETSEPARLDNIGQDALSVRALYGEVDTLIGRIRAGRVPNHWGLGILANGGGMHNKLRKRLRSEAWDCIDCDHGDYIDRVGVRTRIPFVDYFYVNFTWDFVYEGLVGYDQRVAFGNVFDLAQADDVIQFTLSVFDTPMTRQEADEWLKKFDAREPVFDWGVYFVYREQEADVVDPVAVDNDPQGRAAYSDLFLNGLQTFIPDLWGEIAWKWGHKRHVKAGVEVAAIIGEIDAVSVNDSRQRDLLQVGGALETEIRITDAFFGLNTGFATGTEAPGFGYFDRPATGDPNAVDLATEINSFRFDRSYHVDLIMFRELVGGVTNAAYFDAWGEYQFPVSASEEPNILGARLDAITSFAIEPEATPGNARWYGFESDLSLYYNEVDRWLFEIEGGIFIPGDAWDRIPGRDYPILPDPSVYPEDLTIEDRIDAEIAWTIQANLWWLF